MTQSDKPRRLVFDAPKSVGNKTSSIKLVIGDKTFKCHSEIDGITLLEFAGIASGSEEVDEEGNPVLTGAQAAASAGAVLNLLQTCIVDYDEFRGWVKENRVGIEELADYASGLVEQYTDRPTQPPSGS